MPLHNFSRLLALICDRIAGIVADTALLFDGPEAFWITQQAMISQFPVCKAADKEQKLRDAVNSRRLFYPPPIHANIVAAGHKRGRPDDAEVADAMDWITEECQRRGQDGGKVLWTSRNTAHRVQSTVAAIRGPYFSLCVVERSLHVASTHRYSVSPSSAACEEKWSEYGNIHVAMKNSVKMREKKSLHLFVPSWASAKRRMRT